MKPVSYKRILAYLIDIFIVAFLSSLVTTFIPMSKAYETASDDLTEVIEEFSTKKITEEEYLEKVNNLSYTINQESIVPNIVIIVISIVYYVVFVYYNDGQTLGKKLFKIKTVSIKDKKLSMNNYLIRALIINSILVNILSIATILLLNKTMFLKVNDGITTLFGAIYLVTFAMILFRNDGRGLHDLIAGTKVISVKEANQNMETTTFSEVKEAEVIKETKTDDADKTETKSTTKKKSESKEEPTQKTKTSTIKKTTTKKSSTAKKNESKKEK